MTFEYKLLVCEIQCILISWSLHFTRWKTEFPTFEKDIPTFETTLYEGRSCMLLNKSYQRYQRGNQKLYIEGQWMQLLPKDKWHKKHTIADQILIDEGQATQCPKEKGQKGKQRSTKHTHKTNDRITRTSLKTQVLRKGKQFISDLRYSEDVGV
jgi:hypothetical protein